MRTDTELVNAVRQGDLRAFDELYGRYERRLFSYILRLVGDRPAAEDLLQDVFMAVLRKEGYCPERGRFGAWLFTVARRRCLNHTRDRSRRAERLRELAAEPPSATADASPESDFGRRELVLRALEAVSDEHRETLILKEVAGLTCREIASVQDVPEGTVKSRLHHAIRAVRGYFQCLPNGALR